MLQLGACANDPGCGQGLVHSSRRPKRALTSGDLDFVADVDLESVLTAVISPVIADKLTPTDVVVSVTAILRAVGLNMWDLSMWFHRPPG